MAMMYRVKMIVHLITVVCIALFIITPQVASGQNKSILLDPGHGGKDGPGATPPDDATCQYEDEAAAVMDIGDNAYDQISSFLTNEWSVYITRDGDNEVSLDRRVGMANGTVETDGKNNSLPPSGVDFFLSIHADGAQDNTAHGSSIIYPNENLYDNAYDFGVQQTSRVAATVFLTFHVPLTRGTWDPTSPITSSWYSKGVYADVRNLQVLRETEMESALLESEFMTYKSGHTCRAMANLAYQDSAVIGIRRAVGGLDPTAFGDNFVDRYINSDIQNITPTWNGVTVFENKADDEVPGNGRKTYEVTGKSITIPSGSWLIIDRETSAIFKESTDVNGNGGYYHGPRGEYDNILFDGIFENRFVVKEDTTLNWNESVQFDEGLYVQSGATLTVEPGNILEFSSGDSVYVEEGGKLSRKGHRVLPSASRIVANRGGESR